MANSQGSSYSISQQHLTQLTDFSFPETLSLYYRTSFSVGSLPTLLAAPFVKSFSCNLSYPQI